MVDIPLCKIGINNAPLPKHFWSGKNESCSCGSKTRIYLQNYPPICEEKLKETLNKLGYTINKTKNGIETK